MGGKASTQVDSQYFEDIKFKVNILVCGDYDENYVEKDLDKIQIKVLQERIQ